MPLESTPLAVLYPPPLYLINVLYRAVCSYLRHLRSFLMYQSKKYILGGGYNAARGLISRDIAIIRSSMGQIYNLYKRVVQYT